MNFITLLGIDRLVLSLRVQLVSKMMSRWRETVDFVKKNLCDTHISSWNGVCLMPAVTSHYQVSPMLITQNKVGLTGFHVKPWNSHAGSSHFPFESQTFRPFWQTQFFFNPVATDTFSACTDSFAANFICFIIFFLTWHPSVTWSSLSRSLEKSWLRQ